MFERDLFSLNHLPLHPDKMGSAVSGLDGQNIVCQKKGSRILSILEIYLFTLFVNIQS